MSGVFELMVVRIFRLLPSPWVSRIGAFLGRLHARRAIRLRRLWVERLHTNFATLAEISDAKQREVSVVEHIAHIGQIYAEYAILDRLYGEGRFTIRGQQHLESVKGPIIFISAHIGHWELVGEVLRQSRIPVADLYDPIGDSVKLALAMELRHTFAPVEAGNKFIPASATAGRELVRWIADGGNLLLFIDEEKDGLVWSPFLGRSLPYRGNRCLAARLAARYSATVVPLYIRRTEGTHYEAIIEQPLMPPGKGATTSEIHAFADLLTDSVERRVRENLTQWYWLAQLKLDKPLPDNDR